MLVKDRVPGIDCALELCSRVSLPLLDGRVVLVVELSINMTTQPM